MDVGILILFHDRSHDKRKGPGPPLRGVSRSLATIRGRGGRSPPHRFAGFGGVEPLRGSPVVGRETRTAPRVVHRGRETSNRSESRPSWAGDVEPLRGSPVAGGGLELLRGSLTVARETSNPSEGRSRWGARSPGPCRPHAAPRGVSPRVPSRVGRHRPAVPSPPGSRIPHDVDPPDTGSERMPESTCSVRPNGVRHHEPLVPGVPGHSANRSRSAMHIASSAHHLFAAAKEGSVLRATVSPHRTRFFQV